LFEMLGNVIQNLFSAPATRPFPPVRREPFPGTRGQIQMDIECCIFCRRCEHHCPPDAIVVDRKDRTWLLDPNRCIVCGKCVQVCPKDCITMVGRFRSPAKGRIHEVRGEDDGREGRLETMKTTED